MVRRLAVAGLIVALAFAFPGTAGAVEDAAAAGKQCSRTTQLRGGASNPVATGTCPGVRPGAVVNMGGGGTCTLNFVVDGRDADGSKARYIGTAGHCVNGKDHTQAWPNGDGMKVSDAEGRFIGRAVYSELDTQGRTGVDYALIKLEPDVDVNPAMCHWGGPTGLLAGAVEERVELKHYGQGLVYGPTIPARTAWAEQLTNTDVQWMYGAALFGDSGSPIIAAGGGAVGVLSGAFGEDSGGESGLIRFVRIAPAMARAGNALGLQLDLRTAPRTNA